MSPDRDHATKIPNSQLLGTARTTKYHNNHPANIDSLNNQQISLFVPPPFSTLPQAEADAINQIREMLVPPFSDPKIKKKQLKMKSPLVKGEAIIFSHNKGLAAGHASISVPTSLEALCSFDREKRLEITGKFFISEEKLEDVSPSHFVKYFAFPFPFPFHDREFINSTIYSHVDEDTIILLECPTIVKRHQTDSTRSTRVRGTIQQYLEMKRVGPNLTRMDYYSLMNMNGNVPKFVSKILLPAYIGAIPIMRQEHFQNQRQLSFLDYNDGRIMGIMLMTKLYHKKIEERVDELFKSNIALKELLATTFPQFQIMMMHVLRNKIVDVDVGGGAERARKTFSKMKSRFSAYNNNNNKVDDEPAQSQDAEIDEISASDATRIGKKFAMFLLTTTEPTAAVDSWLKDNKELEEFVADNIWFEPMMNAIAKGLLKSSNLGLKWRVGLGAGLSIMDMITDAGVIGSYRASGNTAGAYSLMAMVGSNMAVQLLFTYTQNKKKSKWVILREFAFVVTFLKPAVDAYRVATGHEDEHTVVSPLQEMSFGKAAELAFESIPGGLLQAFMFINSPNKTIFLLISILISTLTTGFTSTIISYDMDISVANRKEVPLFYGYIKDGNTERMITFILQVSECGENVI